MFMFRKLLIVFYLLALLFIPSFLSAGLSLEELRELEKRYPPMYFRGFQKIDKALIDAAKGDKKILLYIKGAFIF